MIIGTSCEKMAGCRSFAYIVSVWSRDSRWARTFSINALGLLWNVSTCTCVDTGVQGADELICTLHGFALRSDSFIVLVHVDSAQLLIIGYTCHSRFLLTAS